MSSTNRQLLSGDGAIALAALHAGVALGTGYPGTPSTEILESFAEIGGKAQWSPNEKVALEVALGAAYGGARAICTMKHVGLNVAADPLFTSAYTGVPGALVVISADDPGMASSQNEQDNRRYAVAAGVPMFEPSDSQEAYDFTLKALELSAHWHMPVLLRVTTRVCHTQTTVIPREVLTKPAVANFVRDVKSRVMIPAFARVAHQKLRQKLNEIAEWNETGRMNHIHKGGTNLGIITSGVCYMHAREAAPNASIFKIGMTYPLPLKAIAEFAKTVERCMVIEEGDPYLADAIRAAGIFVESAPEMFRFGELNVKRLRCILTDDTRPEQPQPPGKPPQLCEGCSHRVTFEALRDLDCIVAGDIGCYTLGVLPPFSAMDTCVCMGASITVGLGLRHVLPLEQAKRVVSVIGDSTFVHSGMTGMAEMIYNPPKSGHVVILLDNGTTAMTGHQEHAGTGRNLAHDQTGKVVYEDLARSLGFKHIHIAEMGKGSAEFQQLVKSSLESGELVFIIARRPCILVAADIREYDKCNAAKCATTQEVTPA